VFLAPLFEYNMTSGVSCKACKIAIYVKNMEHGVVLLLQRERIWFDRLPFFKNSLFGVPIINVPNFTSIARSAEFTWCLVVGDPINYEDTHLLLSVGTRCTIIASSSRRSRNIFRVEYTLLIDRTPRNASRFSAFSSAIKSIITRIHTTDEILIGDSIQSSTMTGKMQIYSF